MFLSVFSRNNYANPSFACLLVVLTISKTNLTTPLGPLNQNPIFSSQKGRFQLLPEAFLLGYNLEHASSGRYKAEEGIPPKRRRARTKLIQADDSREDEKEKTKRSGGSARRREGRVVLTDLGRCNFREDPLRRWAQLVGALTRPLSRPARFTPRHPISAHLPRRPSSSPVFRDFTCEFN